MKAFLSTFLFLLVATVRAQPIIWDGSNDQFWGKGNNWTGGPVPTAADDVVFDDTAFGFTVNLGSESRAANNLSIDSATAYTFENQSGTPFYTLTLGDITVSSGTGHVFNVPLILSTDAAYAIATDLTINGGISGTHSLTKTGSGDLTLSSDSSVFMEIDSSSVHDELFVSGTLSYGGTLIIDFIGDYTPLVGSTYSLFSGYSSQSGTFASLQFQNSGLDGTFDPGTGILAVTAIPESGSFLLLFMAVSSFLWIEYRRIL